MFPFFAIVQQIRKLSWGNRVAMRCPRYVGMRVTYCAINTTGLQPGAWSWSGLPRIKNLLGCWAILPGTHWTFPIRHAVHQVGTATLRTPLRRLGDMQGQAKRRGMRAIRGHWGTHPGQRVIGQQGTRHTGSLPVPLHERHRVGATPRTLPIPWCQDTFSKVASNLSFM